MMATERETLSERIARGHREADDELAGRKRTLEEGLEALARGDWNWAPWLQRSCVFPTRELCELLAGAVTASGCAGLTSIGCGTGLLEWALSYFFDDDHAVCCVDRRPLELQLLPEAARRVFYAQIGTAYTLVRVPADNALLVSWGELPLLTWTSYVRRYRGRCIVVIADAADARCSPSIAQIEQLLGVASDQQPPIWQATVDRLPFDNRLADYTWPEKCLISIFTRLKDN